ncbi:MAG: hypothetical protein OXN83_00860, partial [Oligoflexia bacterium]|nr:hypothetical protein [Oligoflexia bacterium]
MEKQLSFELKILSSGKHGQPSLKKHLSSGKKNKLKQKQTFIIKSQKKGKGFDTSKKYGQPLSVKRNQRTQVVNEPLPTEEKDFKLNFDLLSLEGTQSETSALKETPPIV